MTTRRTTGTLTDAAGTPLAGYTLTFTALASTPATLAAGSAHAVTLDSAGGYDVSLLPGRYAVTLSRQVAPWPAQTTQLGIATVDGGPDIDLLTLIAAPGVEPSEIQHLLDEMLAQFDAAEAAVAPALAAAGLADQHRIAAESAATTATGAASTATAKAGEAATSATAAQAAAQAAEAAVDALVASPTVERIEVVTAAQYDALTPVAGTLYVIEG